MPAYRELCEVIAQYQAEIYRLQSQLSQYEAGARIATNAMQGAMQASKLEHALRALVKKDSEVASGAARPQATSLHDLVGLFVYADQTCGDLYSNDSGTTLVSAEERAAARKAALTVTYTPVAKNDWILQLEPEPQATSGEQSVANVVSLHQAGLLSREEARKLLGGIYGRDFEAST